MDSIGNSIAEIQGLLTQPLAEARIQTDFGITVGNNPRFCSTSLRLTRTQIVQSLTS
jgi:hypothetical protein